MALSGALIIRGGFLPGRLARESPKNAKSSANADSLPTGQLRVPGCLFRCHKSASRKETEMIGVSVGFFCDCEARKTLGKQSQKIHETPKIKRKRAASYVSAASSPSSALMTSLSPAMLRITCVGCAASGGAGVPAGFTHTDARSAAPTPPCGARETRKKSDKRRGGRVSGAFARDARTKRRDP